MSSSWIMTLIFKSENVWRMQMQLQCQPRRRHWRRSRGRLRRRFFEATKGGNRRKATGNLLLTLKSYSRNLCLITLMRPWNLWTSTVVLNSSAGDLQSVAAHVRTTSDKPNVKKKSNWITLQLPERLVRGWSVLGMRDSSVSLESARFNLGPCQNCAYISKLL